MNQVEKARVFATAAHAAVGQKRKYSGEDYIVHPLHVATVVAEAGGTEVQICAALLHDVLEDTQVTEQTLRVEFGNEVTDLVVWLTNVSKTTCPTANRKTRKAADRDALAKAPAEAQTIKLADLISNTVSIVAEDPDFAKTYIPEKKELLEVLTLGDRSLWDAAWAQIVAAEEKFVQDALKP
jgi:(p)ppGpp synthase/HD superfamily hydrolase